MRVQLSNPLNHLCDAAGGKRNMTVPVGWSRTLIENGGKVHEALGRAVGGVPVTEVWAIDDEIGHGALVQLRELGQHVERRHVAGDARPHLPVGKTLEGLWFSRPSHVPLVRSLPLAPAVCQAKGAASINPVLPPAGVGDLRPGLSLFTQGRGESKLPLLDAADLSLHSLASRKSGIHLSLPRDRRSPLSGEIL